MLEECVVGNISFRQKPDRQNPEQKKVSLTIGGIPLVLQKETWDNIARLADKVGTFRIYLNCNGLECANRCLENKDRYSVGQEFALTDGTWILDWGNVEIDNDTAKAIPVLAEKAFLGKGRKGFAIFDDSVLPIHSIILSAPDEYGEEKEHEIWFPITKSAEEIEQYKQEWAKQVFETEEEWLEAEEQFNAALEEAKAEEAIAVNESNVF